MKGFMQLQTIIYVIFAVIILMVGIFSVESYLVNLKVDANYELDEMDLTIIGKRITSYCYTDVKTIQDFSVADFGYKSDFKNLDNNCLSGFDEEKYSLSFFDLNYNLVYSEGLLECDFPDMVLYLRGSRELIAEVCYNA
ncbi:MAG: hypothetical protein VW380_02370 [Candidatus Woesearchaeota archaeon]